MEVLSSPESTISLTNIEILRINEEQNENYELVENSWIDMEYVNFEEELIREIYDFELSNDETMVFYYV